MDDKAFDDIYLELIQKRDRKEKFQLPDLNTENGVWNRDDINDIEALRMDYWTFYEKLIHDEYYISDLYSANDYYMKDLLSPIIHVSKKFGSSWRFDHYKLDIPDYHGTWTGHHSYGKKRLLA